MTDLLKKARSPRIIQHPEWPSEKQEIYEIVIKWISQDKEFQYSSTILAKKNLERLMSVLSICPFKEWKQEDHWKALYFFKKLAPQWLEPNQYFVGGVLQKNKLLSPLNWFFAQMSNNSSQFLDFCVTNGLVNQEKLPSPDSNAQNSSNTTA